jgi:CheY-like chemotaxis protein
LALLLQSWGWKTLVAHDGTDALAQALEHQPGLLLLDIGMPGLSGWEVCEKVRSAAWGQDAVIAACTGWHLPAHAAHSMAAGFDVHLVKPIEPERLMPILMAYGDAAPGQTPRQAVLASLRRSSTRLGDVASANGREFTGRSSNSIKQDHLGRR